MVSGVQSARIFSVPPHVGSRGREVVEVARTAGLELDVWQQSALEAGCAVTETGKWAAFEVAGNVARQNGKGGIIEARELAGVFAFGERLQLHSAHEFQTATEAMLRMEDLLAGTPEFASQVKSVSRSHGSEGFVFRSGQRLRYRTRTKGGGRGFTGDTLYLDEAMILAEIFVAALLPTLSGRSVEGNPQVWYMGSAVDQLVHEHGLVFARLRERGLRGDDPSLFWFEHSMDAETPADVTEEMAADPANWAQANPGLGIRISHEHVANERRSMDPRTFAVERLGVGDWPSLEGDASIFDLERWAELFDADSLIVGAPALAFDVTPDRSWSAIGAAGPRPDGLRHVEVIDHRQGTGWVVRRLVELNDRHDPVSVICDATGPAGALIPELEQAGVQVHAVSATEHGRAAGLLFDAVENRTVRHLGTTELNAAVRGAAKRPLGDAWVWSRRTSAIDICPLVVVTLAHWGAVTTPKVEVWSSAW